MIIHIEDDFDLQKIANSGQCFRWSALPDGGYRIINQVHCLYIEKIGQHSYSVSCDETEFTTVWRDYFDLEENYSAIRARVSSEDDPFLCRAAEIEQGIRILRQDPWEMLITFIISQNKNIPAIRRSVELLCEHSGIQMQDKQGQAFYSFPAPKSLSLLGEQELKECGLGYRWSYIRKAAETVSAGDLNLNDLRAEDEETTIKSLMLLKGVGVKVANCVSLFGLHHIDAFPQDVWIKRIIENEYPQGYPYDRYSSYNGVYQQYMFAYYRHLSNKT